MRAHRKPPPPMRIEMASTLTLPRFSLNRHFPTLTTSGQGITPATILSEFFNSLSQKQTTGGPHP
jgi:hypothetical protein